MKRNDLSLSLFVWGTYEARLSTSVTLSRWSQHLSRGETRLAATLSLSLTSTTELWTRFSWIQADNAFRKGVGEAQRDDVRWPASPITARARLNSWETFPNTLAPDETSRVVHELGKRDFKLAGLSSGQVVALGHVILALATVQRQAAIYNSVGF